MSQIKNKQIFVLEDNEERIKWFKGTFTDYSLDIVDNSQEAYKKLSQNSYAIIFLDHDLGEGKGSGRDVTQKMKEESWGRGSLVILHTNNFVAMRQMREDLESYLPPVYFIPFTSLKDFPQSVFNL